MSKKQFILIIVFSAVVLSGLGISQLRWISNALDLSEEQYDHRVTLALNEVVDILASSTESYRGCTNTECENYDPEVSHLEHVINYDFLEVTLENVFRNYDLLENYEYSLINVNDEDTNRGIFSNTISLKPHENCSSWQTENYQLGVFFPNKQQFLLREMWFWLTLSAILLISVGWLLYFVIFRFMQQKKVADIKNDFINNMTHEFKTPLSTISLASEVLLKSDPKAAEERVRHYSRIIQEENNRMKTQVEYILKMALLQKTEFKLKFSYKNIHDLINEAINSLCLEQFEKRISLTYQYNATDPMAFVDEMHFYNIVTNLISNASKYSNNDVHVTIGTKNTNNGIVISFRDNGIGIKKEYIPHIFDKFYRVPTGNLHNAKGFGLGLYYVKEMVNAHQGNIEVESDLNKGTTFSIFLPSIDKN
ncbi:MAG: sensor histidine kinase [Bacteroidales bacterium]